VRARNVDLSVRVKDHFGQPISNALVEVERENGDMYSQETSSTEQFLSLALTVVTARSP
jgi:hypothetical protein